MKRMIVVLILGFLSIQAEEVIPVAAEPATVEKAGLLEQIRQTIGSKNQGQAEEVRAVVDPSADALQNAGDLEGATDFNFDEESITADISNESGTKDAELSGEEMSGYFADAAPEVTEGVVQ